jgi:hypothetical protein
VDALYPRFVSQIDRDPDSPTYGSCDRQFWMYRLHDFDSGVLQQASLALAGLAELASVAPCEGARHLSPDRARAWTALADAVNRRTAACAGRRGALDEYFPGEQSLPATAFAGFAMVRSATMMGRFDGAVREAGEAIGNWLLGRRPALAANQNMAAAATLAALAAEGWRPEACRAHIESLMEERQPGGSLAEYGGLDLGYLTVSMTYLAHMDALGIGAAGPLLDSAARTAAAFALPSGGLGGEFTSRSTTYFLPYGLVAAAYRDPDTAANLAPLDLGATFAKLDDRYLVHYAYPALVLTALELVRKGVPALSPSPAAAEAPPAAETGIHLARHDGGKAIVALNKGGAFTVDRATGVRHDCGYRLRRDGRIYGTCVLEDRPTFSLREEGDSIHIRIEAGFHRYRQLTPGRMKTIAIRLLAAFGPALNAIFKAVLIRRAKTLAGVTLVRDIEIAPDRIVVNDAAKGLRPGDEIRIAPPASLRLVPSARFHQAGEESAYLESLSEVTLPRSQVIEF